MKLDKRTVKELERKYSEMLGKQMSFVGAFKTQGAVWYGLAFLKNAVAEYPKVMLEVYAVDGGYDFLPSLIEKGGCV